MAERPCPYCLGPDHGDLGCEYEPDWARSLRSPPAGGAARAALPAGRHHPIAGLSRQEDAMHDFDPESPPRWNPLTRSPSGPVVALCADGVERHLVATTEGGVWQEGAAGDYCGESWTTWATPAGEPYERPEVHFWRPRHDGPDFPHVDDSGRGLDDGDCTFCGASGSLEGWECPVRLREEVERLRLNATRREGVWRRTLDNLRAAERERDELRKEVEDYRDLQARVERINKEVPGAR